MTRAAGPLLEFDHIVVGGGTAGCTLAHRLSQDKAAGSVLLIESGRGAKDTWRLRVPLLSCVSPEPGRCRELQSVPQPGLNGRCLRMVCGQGLGGSSAVGDMVGTRGHPGDYDDWAAQGNPGWSFDELLPWFKRSERDLRAVATENEAWHGRAGAMDIDDSHSGSPWPERWREAARQAGWPLNEDFNGACDEGLGMFPLTQRHGERWHAALALPSSSASLTVWTGTAVLRVRFEGRRAVGVEVQRPDGTVQVVVARRQVTLCAGAFGSPLLLQISGVGDGAAVQKLGIRFKHHLPGVGHNLRQALGFSLAHQANDPSLFARSPAGLWQLARSWPGYRRERRGWLTSNLIECGGFLKSTPESPRPDVQLQLRQALPRFLGAWTGWRRGLSLQVSLLRPASCGSVHAAGPDPMGPAVVDPRCFDDPEDMERMVQACRLASDLLQTPALACHLTGDLAMAGVSRPVEVRERIRDLTHSLGHAVGTCRMGDDGHAVVDARLRVHGLQALRVADASVMPSLPGGSALAATVMLAERAAEFIVSASDAG